MELCQYLARVPMKVERGRPSDGFNVKNEMIRAAFVFIILYSFGIIRDRNSYNYYCEHHTIAVII